MDPITLALTGSAVFGGLAAGDTYEKNKRTDDIIDKLIAGRIKRKEQIARNKIDSSDMIMDSTAGNIVQSSNIAVAQNRGALNIPVVQAMMAARLAGQTATAVRESNLKYDLLDMQDESETEKAKLGLESNKQGYVGAIAQGALVGAATGLNISNAMAEWEKTGATTTGATKALGKGISTGTSITSDVLNITKEVENINFNNVPFDPKQRNIQNTKPIQMIDNYYQSGEDVSISNMNPVNTILPEPPTLPSLTNKTYLLLNNDKTFWNKENLNIRDNTINTNTGEFMINSYLMKPKNILGKRYTRQ